MISWITFEDRVCSRCGENIPYRDDEVSMELHRISHYLMDIANVPSHSKLNFNVIGRIEQE